MKNSYGYKATMITLTATILVIVIAIFLLILTKPAQKVIYIPQQNTTTTSVVHNNEFNGKNEPKSFEEDAEFVFDSIKDYIEPMPE